MRALTVLAYLTITVATIGTLANVREYACRSGIALLGIIHVNGCHVGGHNR